MDWRWLKRLSLVVALALIVRPAAWASDESDDVESLIENSQAEIDQWINERGELPPAFVLGDRQMIDIYVPAADHDSKSPLCNPIDFDELSSAVLNDELKGEVVLDVKDPRVRDILGRSCLVRPSDAFMAIGPGWQQAVVVKDFVLKARTPVCPQDAPYALSVTFSPPLDDDPLFFSSDEELESGDNGFQPLSGLSELPLDVDLRNRLSKDVKFLDEYQITVSSVGRSNVDRLITMKRTKVSSEDSELPNEMVWGEKAGELTLLGAEKVDRQAGSGHVGLVGILDFNGDGLIDVVLKGDHEQCGYLDLFVGNQRGFGPAFLPNPACHC